MGKKLHLVEIMYSLKCITQKNISENREIKGISIDSRTVKQDEIFVALRGSNYDAHAFAQDAISKGASFCIVDKNWFDENSDTTLPILVVQDTLEALGELANLYRTKFEIPVVAIAGSNGKTTTKDFVSHILSQRYKVLKTEGNLNNQIGVPLTIFNLNESHDIAVIEIGTNHFGEIAMLCDILEPNYGLITNIGKEHLEAFVDLDGVEMEEASLFGYILKHDGLNFINTDDIRLRKYVKIIERKFTYGQDKENNLRYEINLNHELRPIVTYEHHNLKFSCQLKNPGYSVAFASIPAVAVGLVFGLKENEIIEGLQSFSLPESNKYGRMLIKTYGNLRIINDTYNANPSSMRLALETIRNFECEGKKIAVLGDMLELGSISYDEHLEILKLALEVCDKVFVFGKEMKKAKERINTNKVNYYENKMEISEELSKISFGNETILFKASRGMKCEEILDDFLNKIKV